MYNNALSSLFESMTCSALVVFNQQETWKTRTAHTLQLAGSQAWSWTSNVFRHLVPDPDMQPPTNPALSLPCPSLPTRLLLMDSKRHAAHT